MRYIRFSNEVQPVLPNSPIYIYVLTEPDGVTVRYVGASQEPQSRLKIHMFHGRANRGYTPVKNKWIHELHLSGQVPRMFILEATDRRRRYKAELRWIRHFQAHGCDLVNTSAIRGPKSKRIRSMTIDQ